MNRYVLFITASLFLGATTGALAQGTAFTYQGRLNNGANVANGSYDLSFVLFDSASGGNPVAGPLTNSPTSVSNGLFKVTLDFGDQFPGADRWLEIGVRPSGGGAFATLSPRQRLTATPYAVRAAKATTAASANSVAAANITGTIPLAQLPPSLVTNGASGVSISGTFSGNGTGLTGLRAEALQQSRPPAVAWGWDGFFQTEVPDGLSNVRAIAAGDAHSLALKTDGTIVAWGAGAGSTIINPHFRQSIVPAGLSSVAAIAAGTSHSLALRSNGTVVAWGKNTDGQTNVPTGLSNVVAIASGQGHILALRNDGTVIAWGWNDYEQTNVPAGLGNVVAVAAAGARSLALKSDGTVVGWGENQAGQTTAPAGLNNVIAIAAGVGHSLALRTQEVPAPIAWLTQNNAFQGSITATAFAGSGAGLTDLNLDSLRQPIGVVIEWNSDNEVSSPAGLRNVVAVSAGNLHSLALESDGTVAAWGDNSHGQCNVPPGLSGGLAVAAGAFHSLALKEDGKVVAWGDNNYDETNVPPDLENVIAIAAGRNFSLALKADGTIKGWGLDCFHQFAFAGAGEVSNVVAIAAGGNHSLALKSDGTVVGLGTNTFLQAVVPASLNNVVAIDAGESHSLALKSDGTIATRSRTSHPCHP